MAVLSNVGQKDAFVWRLKSNGAIRLQTAALGLTLGSHITSPPKGPTTRNGPKKLP